MDKPTSETTQSLFAQLSAINVNDKVEKKDKLTYLSWAWAWSEFKKVVPDATYSIGPTEYDDDLGYMVHTTVTARGITHPMWLPVMDGANKSMKKKPYTYTGWEWKNSQRVKIEKTVDGATTFDINKALMRCLVKNLAMFGLGIYIYAGEDLPEVAPEAPVVAAASPIAAAPAEGAGSKRKTATKAAPAEKPAPVNETAPTATTPQLPTLDLGSENWDRVSAYISSNKKNGYDKTIAQVSRKYTLSEEVKAEIKKLIEE